MTAGHDGEGQYRHSLHGVWYRDRGEVQLYGNCHQGVGERLPASPSTHRENAPLIRP